MFSRPITILPFSLVFGAHALAAELEFEGAFQTRARLFDSLSLTEELDAGLPEGRTFYAEHRLWLRPRLLIDDALRLTLDVKGLDNVAWGDRPVVPRSFTGEPLLEDGLSAPVERTDGTAPLLDFTLWRVWADVDTAYGRLSFGRMPLHWGMGIWQNDGTGLNAEYGDTADRVQFEALVQDAVFVRAALDTHAENFVNEADDTYAASLAVAYKRETLVLGAQVHYRRTDVVDGGQALDLVTADVALDAEVGKLQLAAELVGQFGGGDLPGGINDASIAGLGAALDATLHLEPWKVRLQAGVASGDKDDTDARLKSFSFDRDYNLGILLFEQPMPIFRAAAPNPANGNRDFDQVLLGNSVSNALYLKPTLSRTLVDGFDLQASVLLARAAALPERYGDRGTYGTEILGGLRWYPSERFLVDARGGVFLPGTYFKNFTTDTVQGFSDTALGVQVTGRVQF